MELDECIERLQEIRKKTSGKTKLFFDTEGAKFNVHLVEIDKIFFQPKEATLGDGRRVEIDDEDMVLFFDDYKNREY